MFNLVPDIITEYWLGKQEEQKQKPEEEFKKVLRRRTMGT